MQNILNFGGGHKIFRLVFSIDFENFQSESLPLYQLLE